MKKLFLLLPALVLTVALNAAVINITPTSPYDAHDNLRLALHYANSGDEIVLADGTYLEKDNYLYFDKDITVRAAEGASPIVQIVTYAQVKSSANVLIEGIKFDGSQQGSNGNSYGYFFRFYDNSSTSLQLNNCEFYNIAQYVLFGGNGTHTDLLKVNNCYFHNNAKNTIYFEASTTEGIQTCDRLEVRNSTIANTAALTGYTSTIDIRPYGSDVTDAIKVIIDHCTFYNNPTINSDHSAIRPYKLSDVTISNCIFAHPEAYERRATCCYGGTISNCLTFNLTTDASQNAHRQSGGLPAFSGNFTADPLFVDAANGDFSLAGNWVTMNISPARGAATDGSDLGDPRWYTDPVLPSTDFASPYVLTGDKAKLTGNVATDASNYLLFSNSSNATQHGVAIWKMHATRSCILQATLNIDADNGSGHRYQIEVFDSSNTLVGSAIGESANSWDKGDKVISDLIMLSEAGDYKIKLSNLCNNSSNLLHSITLSYIGGAVQTMPGITDIDEAWFVGGTRADGKISFPSSTIQNGWVKWNVSFASAATYKVNLTINSTNGKYYTIALQDADGNNVVTPLEKDGGAEGSSVTLEMGEMTVPAGNYILKVTNSTQWSDAEVISVQFVYEGGAVVNVPAEELVGNEAVLVNAGKLKVTKLANGDLKYGDNSDPLGEYVYWNIHAAKSGRMNVIANVVAPDEGNPSTHNFLVELFADLSEAALATTAEPSATSQTGARELPAIDIPAAGDYIVKLTNQTQWSNAILHSLEFEYVGGDRITLPAACDFEDVILSEKAHITAGELWFNTIGDSNPLGQWAKWNVKVADAGTFLFTMNTTAPSGQSYKISIMDGETEIAAYESGSIGSGNKIVKHYFNLAAGNYTVKIENSYSWSQGHVVSLVVTQPSLLTIDEAATTNSVIHDNYRNGIHDIQIIRTIVAGMYNTICLPFDVSSSQLQAIFGSDVELKQMNSAELEGDVLNLNFDDVTSIYRGTPYLIKTSSDVVNPVFTDVEIKEETGQATTGTNADFIGSFIKGEVPAGEDNLFLGPDNLLYFSQTATPIKGMRAYFRVKGVANPAQAIKRARIVTGGQIATEINLVNESAKIGKSAKIIENGQLVIIRDGIRYNVMGTMIK